MPITAVMFDLGGVVFDSPLPGIARYEREAGLPPGSVTRLNTLDPDGNAWACLERGEIGTDEFGRRYEAEARAAGLRLEAAKVLAELQGAIRPTMLAAVTRLREAGLRTAACTNNTAPLDRDDPEIADLVGRFDVVVESSVERVRKPEPAIYRLVLQRLGVEAEQCAFLDDLGVNLKPARAMGLTTIKVSDPDVALAELADLTGVDLAASAP